MLELPEAPEAQLVIDVLRGGSTGFRPDREAAAEIVKAVPGAQRSVAWSDRFHSDAAAAAVAGGLDAVVFGGMGYPAGTPPHQAAAAASKSARFGFADESPVIVNYWEWALGGESPWSWPPDGDGRARAFRGAVTDPEELLEAARDAGIDAGPVQVHWGLGAVCGMDAAVAAGLATRYCRLLTPGSRLVMAVPEPGILGDRLAAIAGGRAHSPEDMARWLEEAGMAVRAADVRAWGREVLGAALPPRDGRIIGLVAHVG